MNELMLKCCKRKRRTILLFAWIIIMLLCYNLTYVSFQYREFLSIGDYGGMYSSEHSDGDLLPRMVILAGPHKTGTSSVQTNLWLWCEKSFSFHDDQYSSRIKTNMNRPSLNWIWPVPKQIGDENDRSWHWTPAKGFYPMVEVLIQPNERKLTKRKLYDKYTRDEVVDMYHDTIQSYWNEDKNVVIGTEALDEIVRVSSGKELLQSFSKRILPKNIRPSQITVVVSYRTPKADHLISMWHEYRGNGHNESFYDWITATNNNLGVLDALGMVEMFLKYTDWNVVLLDLKGLKENEWDESTFVACEVLKVPCHNRTLDGSSLSIDDPISSPIVTNVRHNQEKPNLSERALGEIEMALILNDCIYLRMITDGDTSHRKRLTIHYPVGLDESMRMCATIMSPKGKRLAAVKPNMLQMVKNVALKHGPLFS